MMNDEGWKEYRKIEERDRKEIDRLCSKIRKERWGKVALKNHKVNFLNYPLIEGREFTNA